MQYSTVQHSTLHYTIVTLPPHLLQFVSEHCSVSLGLGTTSVSDIAEGSLPLPGEGRVRREGREEREKEEDEEEEEEEEEEEKEEEEEEEEEEDEQQ